MRKIIALGIVLLFLGMTISSSTGFNLEKQSTICIPNNPPYVPSDPEPENGSTGVDTGVLSWTGGDPDPDDMVTYEIYFGDETNPPYIMLIGPCPANLTNFIYQIGQPLEYCTTYYWQIVAEDNNGATTEGPLWSFTTMKCSGNILYVGGSGPGNYSKIQDAIDDASNGDTVFVYDDSSPYYETLVVDKSIQLIGEDRDTTVINGSGSGDVVYVTADYTNISRFTIFGGIKVKANFTIISENTIITIQGECIYIGGIWENNSYFNNTIVDNILRSNSNAITIEKSHFNYISGNKVDAGGPDNHGILLFDSKYSIVSGNIIGDCIFGIPILNGTNNIITENIISSSVSGVLLWGEPDSRDCSFNTISRNNIRSNNFSILLNGASMNNIFENNFYSNSSSAYFWGSLGSLNKWSRNYWNRPRLFPKIIFGQITIGSKWIPWLNFDWRPAQEPYDIGV